MRVSRKGFFTTIRSEGSILPVDLLQKITMGDDSIEGLKTEDYHLADGEKLNEAINRSWNRVLASWNGFKRAIGKIPENDPGTSVTREKWLLPLFQELGYGRLPGTKSHEIEGKTYPISHMWQYTPIHLIGCHVDIDRRTARIAGAARISPHGLIQEFLNRSDAHLWAFLSNGLMLRILRDNRSLTRQAYLEFDLSGMMDGEVYSDFVPLWLLCHQSRAEAEIPEKCWLERWSKTAQEQGTRALDRLRKGVEQAIFELGNGFLSNNSNIELREKLREGKLDKQDFYRQLLRLVYRLIFLYVAEDRELLLDPDADQLEKDRYKKYYSAGRLRKLAEKYKGTQHCDLWQGLKLVFTKLGSDVGCPELALPPLGSFLWNKEATVDINDCNIANRGLLEAVRKLTFTFETKLRRNVDFKNLGSEELGSIYESLLELYPEVNIDAGTFELKTASGHERKTTGSYYTPTSLITCLLDSALDPVLDEAAEKENPEEAILNLKVCDPATGSGHFLIAASHRMAKRLASVRTGEDEPSPENVRKALRDIIGNCIYGVDINPMAVELCKVSLWMEAIEPGKPLSFLDHHIKCGNSLLGTTPALIAQGIPNEAFNPIEGDDKKIASAYKKQNAEERRGQLSMYLPMVAEPTVEYEGISRGFLKLTKLQDESIDVVHRKESQYERIMRSGEYQKQLLIANAWCAAFIWRKTKDAPIAVTQDVFRQISEDPSSVPGTVIQEIYRLIEQYRFFHWHLAFPDVFHVPADSSKKVENEQTGLSGGFDVVLGNPPWERIKLQEKEWFASRRPDIANAINAAVRRRMIAALSTEDPGLYYSFLQDRRKAEGESHILRNSGRFPLCGRGDINTYTVFAENKRILLNQTGRVGCIVPSGIATDDTTKLFFQDLMNSKSLVSLFDFENKKGLFPGVHRSYKFCLLTLTGRKRPSSSGAEFVFFAHETSDLQEENRRFSLTAEDIALINPNTRNCPIFRSKRDVELTMSIYRRIPVLINENDEDGNPWGIKFLRMFDMANNSNFFYSRKELESKGFILHGNMFIKKNEESVYLPLYEGKMFWHFDHRFGTYKGQTQA